MTLAQSTDLSVQTSVLPTVAPAVVAGAPTEIPASGPLRRPCGCPPPRPTAAIMEALFRNCGFCLERVSRLIDPILMAASLCQRSCYYVQGMVVDGRAFVATNLPGVDRIHLTPRGHYWAMGGDPACELSVALSGLSPRHAHLNFHPEQGFYLTPGCNSTVTLNGCPLEGRDQRPLRDGDLLHLGDLAVEFFYEVACPVEPDIEVGLGDNFGFDGRMLA